MSKESFSGWPDRLSSQPSPSLWQLGILLALSVGLCAAMGMVVNPQSFAKFFWLPASPTPLDFNRLVSKSYYWDVTAYGYMALKDMCIAFYPLWPWLIRTLFHPQSIDQAAWQFRMVATGLSFASIPLLLWILQQSLQRRWLVFLIALLYYVSPMSIFRFNGYTESLFALLNLLLLAILLPENRLTPRLKLSIIGLLGMLLGMTRAILIPNICSAIAALITISCFAGLQTQDFSLRTVVHQAKNRYYQLTQTTIVLSLSTLIGYTLYGSQCVRLRGNFFAPFKDQELWRKSFGLRLELLLFPKSFLIDLLAFYAPILLFLIAVLLVYSKIMHKAPLLFIPQSPWWGLLCAYPPLLIVVYWVIALRLKLKQVRQFSDRSPHLHFNADAITHNPGLIKLQSTEFTRSLSENYAFWFCIYMALTHAALVFFTQDRMISLGRYTFAVPFIFIAIGYLCRCIPSRKINAILLWGAAISALYLILQWINYGYDAFLG
jgi:hypothetical protein